MLCFKRTTTRKIVQQSQSYVHLGPDIGIYACTLLSFEHAVSVVGNSLPERAQSSVGTCFSTEYLACTKLWTARASLLHALRYIV